MWPRLPSRSRRRPPRQERPPVRAAGDVLPRGALMRRYRRALKAAKLEETHRFHDLRHTFGTAMAAAGVPMRTLQEWMGHRDFATTEIYADYVPNAEEAAMADRAFADPLQAQRGSIQGSNLSESQVT
jgi:integrase